MQDLPVDIYEAFKHPKFNPAPVVENAPGITPVKGLIQKTGRQIYLADSKPASSKLDYLKIAREIAQLNKKAKYQAVIRRYLRYTDDQENKCWLFFNEYGGAYKRLGRYDEAWPYLMKARSLDPEEPAPWDNLAYICVKKGQYKEAIRLYERAKSLNKDEAYRKRVSGWIKRLKSMI